MSHYAQFIWPAYGASAVGLGGAVILVWLAYARAVARLAAVERGT
ncbi:MAG TPA: heme exporter protein CcmD [Rhizomicrobium sp.]|jgi:heme exporter protein CcmD